MANRTSFSTCTDTELIAEVKGLAKQEREATVQLIASLAELDARRLYLGEGCSSMFSYCTQVLHLSEHAAYGRIEAARTARRFPLILDLLGDGSLTLTAVCLLRSYLTEENHRELFDSVSHRSKRDVERIVAQLRPLPPAPSRVRKLPTPKPPPTNDALEPPEEQVSAPSALELHVPSPPRATVAPLAPERYKIQLTVDQHTHDKLRRAQDLLRHTIHNGDLAAVFDRALTALIEDLERTKFARTKRPRETLHVDVRSRHVPAAVKRAVWARDQGRCAYFGTAGRCTERGFLEFHHVQPYAAGGETTTENLELRCRAHNNYEAEQFLVMQAPVVRERAAEYAPM